MGSSIINDIGCRTNWPDQKRRFAHRWNDFDSLLLLLIINQTFQHAP